MKEDEIPEDTWPATAITMAKYDKLKKKADILDFLFGEKGVRTENLMKLQIWREKAELWDQYAIYDNDNEPKILVKDLLIAYEKLEAVKGWWDIFNQCIDSEGAKEKLWKILKAENNDDS